MKIIDHFRGIYSRISPNLIEENRRMSTCNLWDLQTRGSPLIMPKNLPVTVLHTSIKSMDVDLESTIFVDPNTIQSRRTHVVIPICGEVTQYL